MKEKLCREIETALHRDMQTPKDFEFLRKCIFARQHLLISTTTLKRVWGYLNDSNQPRVGTLDILAQFLGYRNWENYSQGGITSEQPPSSPVMSRRLNIPECLDQGDRLRLTWQPKRVCDVEYLGDLTFRVIASENTRLREGNTFKCSIIIEGEPLYLDSLQQENRPPIAYICGKRTGVRFEYILP
ncbi:MAG: hypothetical protein J1E37_01645 [Prevotella sp.]|nr:hypothetical protein [Prevotella sp.]